MHADPDDLILHRGRLTRSMFAVRVVQLCDLAFAVLAVLLLGRFLLEYSGHHSVQPEMLKLRHAAEVVATPFRRVPSTRDPGGHPLAWAYVAALVAYGFVYRLLVGMVRRAARPPADLD